MGAALTLNRGTACRGRVAGGRRGVGHQPSGSATSLAGIKTARAACGERPAARVSQHAEGQKRLIQIRVLARSYGRSSVLGVREQRGKNATKQEERYRE